MDLKIIPSSEAKPAVVFMAHPPTPLFEDHCVDLPFHAFTLSFVGLPGITDDGIYDFETLMDAAGFQDLYASSIKDAAGVRVFGSKEDLSKFCDFIASKNPPKAKA